MAKAYKRVLDEILASVPTIFDPKTVETLVVKYMQEARKQLLQSHQNASSGRGMNHRRTEYRHRQKFQEAPVTCLRLCDPHLDPFSHCAPRLARRVCCVWTGSDTSLYDWYSPRLQ